MSDIFSLYTKIILFFYPIIQKNFKLLKKFRIAMLPCYRGFSLSATSPPPFPTWPPSNPYPPPSAKKVTLSKISCVETFPLVYQCIIRNTQTLASSTTLGHSSQASSSFLLGMSLVVWKSFHIKLNLKLWLSTNEKACCAGCRQDMGIIGWSL